MTSVSAFPLATSVAGMIGGISVSPSSSNFDHIVLDPLDCYAGIQFNSSGEEFKNVSGSNQNFTTSRGNWLDSGSSSDVWIERTVNVGSLDWLDAGSGRLNLGTTREFGIERTSLGTDFLEIDFDFWDAASGGNLLGSSSVDISAEVALP